MGRKPMNGTSNTSAAAQSSDLVLFVALAGIIGVLSTLLGEWVDLSTAQMVKIAAAYIIMGGMLLVGPGLD
jgi:hypothetical protein